MYALHSPVGNLTYSAPVKYIPVTVNGFIICSQYLGSGGEVGAYCNSDFWSVCYRCTHCHEMLLTCWLAADSQYLCLRYVTVLLVSQWKCLSWLSQIMSSCFCGNKYENFTWWDIGALCIHPPQHMMSSLFKVRRSWRTSSRRDDFVQITMIFCVWCWLWSVIHML